MRLGILGGTFDPIHLAHLIVAQETIRIARLDRILFIPASVPPHKTYSGMASAAMRYEMVRLAIDGNPDFTLSDVEICRSGPSYTVETLQELRRSFPPEVILFLIIGEDNVRELPTWYHPEEIFDLCTMLVVSRPGEQWLEGVDSRLTAQMQFIKTPLIDISSTEVRRRVASGESIRHLVPEPVERYIVEHGLYRKS